MAADDFLDGIAKGKSHPRRLEAFGGDPLAAIEVKRELRQIAVTAKFEMV